MLHVNMRGILRVCKPSDCHWSCNASAWDGHAAATLDTAVPLAMQACPAGTPNKELKLISLSGVHVKQHMPGRAAT